ncbi:hypothetical protein LU276_02620 [Moraxella haemolytica]|uniref:hypothetical protein n=1 Tax=Moraxella haemolytica TaxID=2904119 RepID=UPI00254376D5|nr:hypothetical protein [Moraxella sp. ZY171148]WII95746.1 hypothetical protein LU276_02620 [Moraxella sp. ZY171148]
MFQRQLMFFVACALPLLFAHQLPPNMARELDFWLIWLVAMSVVGLPVLFAEFALSARSGQTPWLGMQKLTREADASMVWRIFAGLSVLVSILIAVNIVSYVAGGFKMHMPQVADNLGVPSIGIATALSIVVLILSLLKSRLLPVGLLLILVGSLISLFDGGLASGVSIPVLTQVTLGEWGRAVLLALLSVGVGTGLYWFGSVNATLEVVDAKKSLTGMILPIWFTQLIFGSLALLAGSAMVNQTSFVVAGVGMLLVAAFLLSYAGGQLIARFGMMAGGVILLALGLAFGLLPSSVLLIVLSVISLVAVVVLAIFAGFVMKISHLRKILNFGSELRYNVWRVLIRIVVPMAVLVAFVGLVTEWLM